MYSIIGSVSPFNETEDTWHAYAERLDHFFLANEIDPEAEKRAVLLSSMGFKPYKLLSTLVAPRKAGESSYTEIVDVLKNHHNPRPSTIVQRFKFNTRVCGDCESIRTFVAELKKLSEFCVYNDSLEEMLRDRLYVALTTDAYNKDCYLNAVKHLLRLSKLRRQWKQQQKAYRTCLVI